MAIFRIEKTKNYTVMSNHHLKDKTLSLKSKGLLSVILSLPEEWNYSTRGLAAISKEGVDSIGGALKELENAGYLVRNKLRDERGRITDTEYVIYEYPQDMQGADEPNTPLPDTPSPDTEKPYTVKPNTDLPQTEKSAQLNTNQTNPNELNTHGLNIHQSIPSYPPSPNTSKDGVDKIDAMDSYRIYRELIHENIEYDYLREQNPYHIQEINEIVEIMLETACSKRKTIRIGGEDMPGELVRSRMLKIDVSHIKYVLECLAKNASDIRNIKAYLLTTIYNAPNTIDSYYRAAVNHDFRGSS